ncbi:MAG: hypothetical protein MK289_20335 [Trichodesmium sp. ALOHA_ZT_67]|nr:hypothetical protein [Trichodesmium sp. ALOHA_ZT_67]
MLDECLPKKLKKEIINHQVITVPEQGWVGIKNGELLKLVSSSFDAFITIEALCNKADETDNFIILL